MAVAQACLRSLDAFGVSRVHIVLEPAAYDTPPVRRGREATPERREERAAARIGRMRSAAGSAAYV